MAALIRTLIVTLALIGSAMLIFWRVSIDHRQQALEQVEALNRQLEQQLAQRTAMIERLSRTRRIAYVEVLDQRLDAADHVLETDLLFIELSESGRELARQTFTLPGDVIYFDAWTVKFDPEMVAEGHPLRGRTLVLLRRVFSEVLPARDGLAIDTPGAVPSGYADDDMMQYERHLWKHFWDIATDWRIAAEMGVRVAQGEAVYKPMRTGQQYQLIVDAAGGINLLPVSDETIRQLTRVHE